MYLISDSAVPDFREYGRDNIRIMANEVRIDRAVVSVLIVDFVQFIIERQIGMT